MKLIDIVGKSVKFVKGYPTHDKREKYIEPAFVLFDDRRTILELREQDYYSYHDCASSARLLSLYEDCERWARFSKFPDANTNI
jgi:hypothetical protein